MVWVLEGCAVVEVADDEWFGSWRDVGVPGFGFQEGYLDEYENEEEGE